MNCSCNLHIKYLIIIEKRPETLIKTRVIDMEKSALAAVFKIKFTFLKKYIYTKIYTKQQPKPMQLACIDAVPRAPRSKFRYQQYLILKFNMCFTVGT